MTSNINFLMTLHIVDHGDSFKLTIFWKDFIELFILIYFFICLVLRYILFR